MKSTYKAQPTSNQHIGARGDEDLQNFGIAFEESQKLYELEFGSRMISIWSNP